MRKLWSNAWFVVGTTLIWIPPPGTNLGGGGPIIACDITGEIDLQAQDNRYGERPWWWLLAQRMRTKKSPEDDLVEPLTDREKDVLRLLGQGMSNKEIGAALFITERTARTYVSNILGKLGLASRTQAALYAVEHKLTE